MFAQLVEPTQALLARISVQKSFTMKVHLSSTLLKQSAAVVLVERLVVHAVTSASSVAATAAAEAVDVSSVVVDVSSVAVHLVFVDLHFSVESLEQSSRFQLMMMTQVQTRLTKPNWSLA